MPTRLSRVFRCSVVTLIALFSVALAPDALGQGTTDYLNFESIQTNPLAVASVGGFDYLIVCNTPDNSLEIYDVTAGGFAPLDKGSRVPVGLEPVSVTTVSRSTSTAEIYVVSFVGDSVTHVRLHATRDPRNPRVEFQRTVNVAASARLADEPIDVAVLGEVVLVALRNSNSVARFDRALNPLVPHVVEVNEAGANGRAMKEPRRLATFQDPSQGSFTWVLDTQGGGIPGDNFNLALYSGAMASPIGTRYDDLGSTNFGMAIGSGSSDLGDLYIVAQRAQVFVRGEENVRRARFGFAESVLIAIDVDYRGSAPWVARERNLNEDSTGQPVPPTEAIAQPMAVLPYYRGSEDTLFVASFGTDRVVRLGNLGAPAIDWTRQIFDLGVSGAGSPIAGPRGFALVEGINPDLDRLFVFNRLDNSIAVISPNAATPPATPIVPIPLQNDPTPQYVRDGREFLYNARLAATGFVSCASCHIDGRLDGLRWDLSDGSTQYLDLDLVDDTGATLNKILEPDKGAMVTQSLQGLVNWEAELDRSAGLFTQEAVTNAPYHWRGDRADFNDFLGAFPNLIGTPPGSITLTEMHQFERFVNSISYPPNPLQAVERQFPLSDLGADPNAYDPQGPVDIGSGFALGLKAMHVIPSLDGRSCSHCHSLPEGSSNLIPQKDSPFAFESPGNGPISPAVNTNAEVPGLRGQSQKLIRTVADTRETGGIGIFKTGSQFTAGEVAAAMIGSNEPVVRDAVAKFVQEIDSGVAPMVGRVATITASVGGGLTVIPTVVADMITQAGLGNIGLVLEVWKDGDVRGYWYDQSAFASVGFREETAQGPGSLVDYATVVAGLGGSDRVVAHAVPLGSERRVAAPTGAPQNPPLVAAAPVVASWLELAPNSLHRWVPLFVGNWNPPVSVPSLPAQIEPLQASRIPVLLQRIRPHQEELQIFPKRHEPPRRLRIAGTNIRHGAQLEVALDGTCGTAYDLELPLYATGDTYQGMRVWTTAVEFEPEQYYPWLTPRGSLHAIRVTNRDGTSVCLDGVEIELQEIPGFTRGDVNGDGIVNNVDIITLQSGLSSGSPFLCDDAADIDDDGDVDNDDLLAFIDFFTAGLDPTLIPYPGPGICGPDMTEDSIDCGLFTCP